MHEIKGSFNLLQIIVMGKYTQALLIINEGRTRVGITIKVFTVSDVIWVRIPLIKMLYLSFISHQKIFNESNNIHICLLFCINNIYTLVVNHMIFYLIKINIEDKLII